MVGVFVAFKAWLRKRSAASKFSTARPVLPTWPDCRVIGWKRCSATVEGSIVFGSMTSGASALSGAKMALMMLRSLIIIEKGDEMPNQMRPIHPGEILEEELQTLGLSARQLARALAVPPNRISSIVHQRRA